MYDKDFDRRLEITALMHDICIQVSEENYHSSAGNYQELYHSKLL